MTHNLEIHVHRPDPPSALRNQIRARKERLQRFAEAAHKHMNAPKAEPPKPLFVVNPVAHRREYEVKDKLSPYVPIARRILKAVATEFGMTIEDVICRNHHPKYTVPRFVAMGLMLEMTKMSLPAIGRQLGGRDHTTVINGRRHAFKMFAEEAFRNRVDQIKASIQ